MNSDCIPLLATVVHHFDWAHISINPGHLGLFVMNSAKFAKMIIIDSNSSHAPEYILAKIAKQPFINFENIPKSKSDLEKIFYNKLEIKNKTIIVMISGGNIDNELFSQIVLSL